MTPPEAAGRRTLLVREAVTRWRDQLIDLSGRNQLLFYRDLKVGTLDLATTDPRAWDVLMSGRRVALTRLFGQERHPDVLKRAKAIRAKATEAAEERGIQTCYAAFGMVTWQPSQGHATRASPVLLRQATLSPTGAAQTDFELELDEDYEVNPFLLHLLKTEYGVDVNAETLLSALDRDLSDLKPLFEMLIKETGGVPEFALSSRRLLGNFSFAKLPMVTDLESHQDALAAHDVVATLAGDAEARRALLADHGTVDLLDPDHRPPDDEFLVLDADASQSYAINSVLAGDSIVISGPPGTGKSQTIANLVTSLVSHGRSVLFVAEKQAAIAAVVGRLERIGLDDLVLDLHDTVKSRRRIAESLASSLSAAGQIRKPEQEQLHATLVDRRDHLNAHDSALHRQRAPWQLSVFDAQAELLGLAGDDDGVDDLGVILSGSALDAMDPASRRLIGDRLAELASLGGFSLTAQDSPWVGAGIDTPEQADQALALAVRLRDRLPSVRTALDQLIAEASLARPASVSQWREAWDVLDSAEDVITRLDPSALVADVFRLAAATGSRRWRKEHLAHGEGGDGWWTRRAQAKIARGFWRANDRPSTSELHEALVRAIELNHRWRQLATDDHPPHLPPSLPQTRTAFDEFATDLAALDAIVQPVLEDQDLDHVLPNTLESLTRDRQILSRLPRTHELRGLLGAAGLRSVLEQLQLRRSSSAQAAIWFRRCFLRSFLERARFGDPVLASFDGRRQEATAAEFRRADSEHIRQTVSRVRRAAAERLVAARDDFDDQSALVQQQAQRKRGHLPLRDLFRQAPDVMTAVKPCWAMSPLLVSQLLPGDRPYFDVVIFDEASQVLPADAVPAILRGRQLVVAGDAHQLPPTSFFATTSDELDEPQVIKPDGAIDLALTSGFESILDVMSAGLGPARQRSLLWHYRSRDERLIAFSNVWIYDRSLITFPGVIGEDSLSHVLVEQQPSASGQEDSVTAEVRRVVELIITHAQERPDESLGVITMGIKHAQRIDTLLRETIRPMVSLHSFFAERPAESFFIKNLERVQGDERDAIILSIGYGRTGDGRLPYRFGPLLQEGGHRRLNVAVTRARSRMTLVSSFSHLDMDPSRSSAEGVRMLRAYLQFAASHGASLGDQTAVKEALNPFEISVKESLEAAGIPLVPQYGVAGYWIDFAARHPRQPGRMVLAIEADGATYHSTPTARDRDRLRQEQLERLGWTFHRIWSTDWFADASACIERVRVAYAAAVEAADRADQAAAEARTQASYGQPEPDTELDFAPPAEPAPVRTRAVPAFVQPGMQIGGYTDGQLIEVISWIRSDGLLRTEDQLFDEFRRVLGFQKRGSRIQAAFERAIR